MANRACIGIPASAKRFLPGRPVSSITKAHSSSTPPTRRTRLGCGDRRAAGGKEIVNQQDSLASPHGVTVHFQRVRAVFQGVGLGNGLMRQLARLPYRHEAHAERSGYRRAEDQPPRLDSRDLADVPGPVAIRQQVCCPPESRPVLNKRCNIAE